MGLLPGQPKPTRALQPVYLDIHPGEIFGLLGPNGAGKTTLIKTLATLVEPTAGQAFIDDISLNDQGAIKSKIGLASRDERSFYWRLTGRENLAFFARLYGLGPKTTDQRVQTVLELLDIQAESDLIFSTYSTGMKQRLSIARALLSEPAVLLLDEPSRGLDPIAQSRMHSLIQGDLSETGLTILLSTHRLDEAAKICDRLAILDKGAVLAVGTVNDLLADIDAENRYSIEFAEASDKPLATKWVRRSELDVAIKALHKKNQVIVDIAPDAHRLEDAFAKILQDPDGLTSRPKLSCLNRGRIDVP